VQIEQDEDGQGGAVCEASLQVRQGGLTVDLAVDPGGALDLAQGSLGQDGVGI
jgi:hypothetical protein